MKDLRIRRNILVALLVFSAILAVPSVHAAQGQSFGANGLVAGTSAVRFGTVAVGSSANISEYVFNPTSSSVTISGAVPTDADFQVSQPSLPATVGARRWVQLVFTFTPHAAGVSSGSITISSTAATASLTLSISGTGSTSGTMGGGSTGGGSTGGGSTGAGQIAPSASSLSFGSVTMGSSQTQSLTVTNSGSTTLLLYRATSNDGDFAVNGVRFPVVIAAGRSVSLNVVFAPTATGTRSGSITLAGSSSLSSGAFGRGTPATAAVVVTGVGASQSSSGGSGGGTTTPGSLASPGTVSFGTLPVGTSTQKTATITNSGGSTVNVSNAVVSGNGFSMSTMGMPMTLAPNQSMNVNITCAPKTSGTLSGSLTVNSDASDATLSVPLSVTAVAAGALTVAPSSFSFGSVQAGSTQSLPATLTNTGGTSVTVSQATFSGSGYSTTGLTLPLTLAAGQSVAFNVVFAPTSAGTDNFTFSLTSNASNPSLTAAVTGSSATSGTLSASASSLAFGSVTVNSTKSLPETVTNSGGSSITLTQTAAGAGYTVQGLTLPVTLAAGASTSFNVVFAPTSAVSSSVNLAITTSNPSSSLMVALSGSGATSGAITVSPVSFGSVQVGNSSNQSATLKNSGGSSVTISSATLTGTASGFTMSGLAMPLTLNAGQTFTFNVTFAPTSAGAATGSIALTSDATASPSIALSGTATAAGQFSVNPNSLSFGSVTVNQTTTLPITLSATGGSITVSAASVSNGAEFKLTGPALPLTIPAGGTASFSLAFDPQTSGATTATVSFTSSASSSPVTAAVTGSGAAAKQHSVTLSWLASTMAVAGYNVYRGTVSGGPYSKLDSSVDTTNSYADSTVLAGQTYFYVTTAVGTDGTESGYSNQVTAAIPTP